MNEKLTGQEFGPWNPGIESQLPRELLTLSTVFNEGNVTISAERAHELSDFCGLPAHTLVPFRPERLIVHELLVRVMADLAVPDGRKYEDLGINFRAIVSIILEDYITPYTEELSNAHTSLLEQVAVFIDAELSAELFAKSEPAEPPPEKRPFLEKIGIRRPTQEPPERSETAERRLTRVLAAWKERANSGNSPLESACWRALVNIITAISGRHGKLVGDKELICELAMTFTGNDYGSKAMGERIQLYIEKAVEEEGYRWLPAQEKPVVMNVKGASAAGKSTTRPLQRILAGKLGVPWDDFALISPDIWRKFLLDYESLGTAYKYAGTLTGHEVEIIDKKLDAYMAEKATSGRMSHLLIDRFRFDSFVPESEGDDASKLLTRFGDLVYLFFMVTPPEATVERAWHRGVELGRYKAVEDLLDHNVEAYTGMPQLFFTWALRTKKRVHYEFLDNSVPKGETPRTVAFGWNGEMTILDVKSMLDIDRFKKINIYANTPSELYEKTDQAPEKNTGFLEECRKMIPKINFAEFDTGKIYGRIEGGEWAWRDEGFLPSPDLGRETCAGLTALDWKEAPLTANSRPDPERLDPKHAQTMGRWGPAAGK
ncbi:MAG: hypothetical protein ACR2OR_08890 [Hyphomicrobiales bacterium]